MSEKLSNSGAVAPAEEPQARMAPYPFIRNAILTGEFEPGEPLVESRLAVRCGVSRTPVREALRRLQQDGLVERTDRGIAVKSRSPQEIMDIYETRIVLEARAAQVAAERRTDYDLHMLNSALTQGESIADDDPSALIAANRLFHLTLWRATHNEALLDVLERLELHIGRYPGTTLSAPGRWEHAISEHAELVDAVLKRNGSLAHNVAMKHLKDARDIRVALFAGENLT